MRKAVWISGVLCLSAVMSGVQVRADDVDLEKIVVTSTRSSESVQNTPNNVTVITRKDIEKSSAKTILDVLREKSGVVVKEYSAGNGKLANVDIRGFGETGTSNTLVLVDGRRVTQIDLSGTDWAQIPLAAVERVEIIKGAASVFYGDNATGGVVNIITKEGTEQAKIEAKAEVGSYASYNKILEASGHAHDFSYYALAKHYESAGYRNNNAIISRDFAFKVGRDFSDMLNTKINFGYHKDKYGLAGALTDDQINSEPIGRKGTVTPLDNASSEDYFGDLTLENDFSNLGKFVTDLSMRVRQVKSNYMSSFPWQSDNYITTLGFTPKYILNSKLVNHNNKVTMGFDFYDIQDHIKEGAPDTENNVITISRKSYGLYIFDQLSFTEKLTGSAGYRFEKARYNFEQISAVANQQSLAKTRDAQVLTSGLNYIYDGNDSNMFINFSQSFRFPLVDEMFASGYPSYGGGGLDISLDPQRANNYEIGARHYFTKNIYSGLAFYRMNLHNEIYYDPYANRNSDYDKTVHQGLEYESKARLWDKMNLFANYTFTDAQFLKGDFAGNKIPAVPSHKWAAGFDLDLLAGYNFSLITNYVGESYFISDQRNRYPRQAAYTTVDIKLSYKREQFTVYTGINNLFNQEYSEMGGISFSGNKYYYPSAKRNFILGGSLKF